MIIPQVSRKGNVGSRDAGPGTAAWKVSQKLVHIFVLTGASRLLVLAKAMMKTCMGREVKQVNALSNNIGLVAYSLIGFQQGKSTISWSMGAAII